MKFKFSSLAALIPIFFGVATISTVATISHTEASEMTLFFIPSPAGINWNSPATLAHSVYTNGARKRYARQGSMIGHVVVRLRCEGRSDRWAGMTQARLQENQEVVMKQGMGLGLLFHIMTGRLEDETTAPIRVAKMISQKRVNFLQIKVADLACDRATHFLEEYKKTNAEYFYGFPIRPRYGEGAGCTSFGVAFLEVAGVAVPEWLAAWTRRLNVPMKYIGGPLNPTNRVGFLNLALLAGSSTRWARSDEAHLRTQLYDPELMFEWTASNISFLNSMGGQATGVPSVFKYVEEQTMPGLSIDLSASPVPFGPVLLTEGRVDFARLQNGVDRNVTVSEHAQKLALGLIRRPRPPAANTRRGRYSAASSAAARRVFPSSAVIPNHR